MGSKPSLHGFSGGGQFSNRFALLHPDRVSAVSIGAPGRITLPVSAAPMPVQVVVGVLDDNPSEVAAVTGDPDARGRLTQARVLADTFRELGSQVRLDVVDGVGHEGGRVVDVVADFLREQLRGR